MNHADHVRLLEGGVQASGGVWADLGSGRGAFTLALAELIGPTGIIYSVDLDQRALGDQALAMQAQFPATLVHYVRADFTQPLELPPLDGVVMANALHFVPRHRQGAVVQAIRGYLRPGGRLVLVEYNLDEGNPWVPYPVSYPTWDQLSRSSGFGDTRLLAKRPSRFLREIYSAASW